MDGKPSGRRREIVLATVRSLLMTGALIAAYYLLPLTSEFTAGTVIALVGGLVAVSLLLAWQAAVITRSPRPQLRAVEAVATALPFFLLLFAVVYYLLDDSAPESFSEPLSRTDALYFTVTVFTTVGFGDISPRSEPARLLVTGNMVIDLVLIGVAAKLLVEAVQRGLRQQSRTATEGENGGETPAR
ncbi:potassium channel family protein [Streptomyces sp. NPDC006482]|uniref:potassium channel family protein n=1 Tax=Streptomyces sp. NPDC006482 TaxID=3154306 RepID=UPI00339FB37D